jgi:plastocyanin
VLAHALAFIVVAASWPVAGQSLQGGLLTVTGTVMVTGAPATANRSDVVVWLTPVGDGGRPRPGGGRRFKILQQNKRFQPHVLVVPAGAVVDFPNLDPIFHNVFSLFDGKRFDLGLYEAGTTRGVTFANPGVCYIFCNIHPEMSAVVVVVDSPFYAASDASGTLTIDGVPAGRYRLGVWHERLKPENPAEFPREIVVSPASTTLGSIRLVETNRLPTQHKNKFGHDYVPTTPSPIYP